LLFLFSLLSGSASAEEWSGEIQITNADSYAGTPAVGIDAEDNIYVVWEEGKEILNMSYGSRQVHFMKLAPDGEVLQNRTLASALTLDSSWPDIAVEKDGMAHIVWQDSNPLHRNIYYQAITPEGDHLFNMPIPIAQGSLGTYTPSIAVDESGLVHIVWLDLRLSDSLPNHEIFYTQLDPSLAQGRGGDASDEDIRLIDDTQISSDLKLIDIIDFYEFITGFRIFEYPPFPDAVVNSAGNVHIVWTDGRDGNPEIYYSVLDPTFALQDGSPTNHTIISLVDNSRLTWNPSLSLQPKIAIGPDDSVHLAYTDNITDSYEVYYALIDQVDSSIDDTLQLVSKSDGDPSGLSPIFIDQEGNAYITWRDMCCDRIEIYLSKISPSREIIWDNQRISHSNSTVGNPPSVVDSNLNPIIFWQDNRTSTSQIYYNRTTMFPDLSIEAKDITTDAMDGSDSHLYITIHNNGNLDASTPMRVTSGDEEWNANIHILGGQTKTYTFDWDAEEGDYIVSVDLDPENSLVEPTEEDNDATVFLYVPYPPSVGISEAEVVHGGETYEIFGQSISPELFLPLTGEACWFNLSIYNSGGYHTGPMNILVRGDHESGELDPIIRSTQVNMNSSMEDDMSFVLEPIPGKWNYELVVDSESALQDAWKESTELSFSIEFLTSPDPSVTEIQFDGSLKEDEDITIIVGLQNSGLLPSSGELSLHINGRVQETRIITLIAWEERTEDFSWTANAGDHSVTAVLDLHPDNDTSNNSMSEQLSVGSKDGQGLRPIVISVSMVAVLATILVAFTESGRYNFLKFMVVPLYTRLKRGKILDHFMRGQVYGFIKANPGAHYNLIRRQLEINNGALAYHIAVLEREKFIRSRMDGTLKRFYPSDMNLPTGHEFTEMERKLIDILRANPGFSQKEIALTLGLSPQVVNYHIKSLARNHILRLNRVGKRTLCYINENVGFDS